MAIKVTEHTSVPRGLPCILKWVPNSEEEVNSPPAIVLFYEHDGEIWGINLCETFPHPENTWINCSNHQWVPTTITIKGD